MLTMKNRGFSLIEVLVTMVIVAIGLLGLLALQMRSFGLQTDSLNRKAASELTAQFVERLGGNKQGYDEKLPILPTNADAVFAPSTTLPAICSTNCTAAQVWNRDVALWVADARRRLPGAVARIAPTYGGGSVVSLDITLGWQEPNAQREVASDSCESLGTTYRNDPSYRCMISTIFPG